MILDFLNEPLPWRNCKDNDANEVRDCKAKCMAEPEKYLWKTTTANLPEVRNIFYSLSRLRYQDRPNYRYIREQLNSMLQKEEAKEPSLRNSDTKSSVDGKKRKKTTPSVEIIADYCAAAGGKVKPVAAADACEIVKEEEKEPGKITPQLQQPFLRVETFPTPLCTPKFDNKVGEEAQQNEMKEFFRVEIDKGYYEKVYGSGIKQNS